MEHVSQLEAYSSKAVVNTRRIIVLNRTIPDVGLVLMAKEILLKLLLTRIRYVKDYTVETVRLPTRRFFDVIAREDLRKTTMILDLPSWRNDLGGQPRR